MNKLIKAMQKISLILLALPVLATAQTGGQFAITQSVIAGGGGGSSGGSFGVTGTTAQSIVGTNLSGGTFGLRGGFWQEIFVPTAAMVSVSGKVTTANGGGIANVRVLMTKPSGEIQTAVSGTFGNFRFDDVAVGEVYVFTVQSKRYQFSVRTQVLAVNDNVTDLIFIADWK